MLRYHRRRPTVLRSSPSPYSFNSAEMMAWLDAICALQLFRIDAGQGGVA